MERQDFFTDRPDEQTCLNLLLETLDKQYNQIARANYVYIFSWIEPRDRKNPIPLAYKLRDERIFTLPKKMLELLAEGLQALFESKKISLKTLDELQLSFTRHEKERKESILFHHYRETTKVPGHVVFPISAKIHIDAFPLK